MTLALNTKVWIMPTTSYMLYKNNTNYKWIVQVVYTAEYNWNVTMENHMWTYQCERIQKSLKNNMF